MEEVVDHDRLMEEVDNGEEWWDGLVLAVSFGERRNPLKMISNWEPEESWWLEGCHAGCHWLPWVVDGAYS